MSDFRCKGCLGEYSDVQRDGTRYFHVCPDSVPAQDRRNENLKSTAEKDASTVTSEGKGADAK